ncbi:nucleotidyltransferase domain-containing protein [Candidatus Woesearchaeota archaeon]|nr:nucleotidyltransferase domain-containing protein [Candidatus Woesearchaeota archaeon]
MIFIILNYVVVLVFIESLLGATSRVKILRTLTEVTIGFTLSELEKETGLSRGIVHKEIKRLVKEGVVIEVASEGKLKSYRINVNHPHHNQIVSLFGKEKLVDRRSVVMLAVWNVLESLVSAIVDKKKVEKGGNIQAVKLFGSHSRGTAALTSDIDLLVILWEKNPEDEASILAACEKYGKKLKTKINPVFMTAERYTQELATKTAFIDQVNRSSIDLYFNGEQHYG